MEGAGGLEGEGRGAASYPRGQKAFPGSMAGMGMGDRVEQSGSTLACAQREVRDQTNQNGLLQSVSGIQFGNGTAPAGAKGSYRRLVRYLSIHIHYKDLPTLHQYKC